MQTSRPQRFFYKNWNIANNNEEDLHTAVYSGMFLSFYFI